MHLSQLAAANPDKSAYIMAGSGQTFTYSDLEQGSNQLAQLFRSLGLVRGDHIAILLENHPLFIQICVAAQRAGLYYTAISYRLQSEEVSYIVNDCGAKVFITSKDRQMVVEALLPDLRTRPGFHARWRYRGFESLEDAMAAQPGTPMVTKVWARRCCIPPVPQVGRKAYSGSCLRRVGRRGLCRAV